MFRKLKVLTNLLTKKSEFKFRQHGSGSLNIHPPGRSGEGVFKGGLSKNVIKRHRAMVESGGKQTIIKGAEMSPTKIGLDPGAKMIKTYQ